MCVFTEAGSDQNPWRTPPWIFWTWVLLHTPCSALADFPVLYSHTSVVDLIAPVNCRESKRRNKRHFAISRGKNTTAKCQIVIINIKCVHAINFFILSWHENLLQGYFLSVCVYTLGNNQLESQLTSLNFISYSNRGRPNSSELLARYPKNKPQIRSRTLNSVFTGCCLPKTNHLLLPDNTMEDSFSFFPPFSLRQDLGQDPNSRLWCESTGIHNLITCFICRNLFLNQSGWRRKHSSWVITYTSLSRCSGTSDTFTLATFTPSSFYLESLSRCSWYIALTQETTCDQISGAWVHLILSVCKLWELLSRNSHTTTEVVAVIINTDLQHLFIIVKSTVIEVCCVIFVLQSSAGFLRIFFTLYILCVCAVIHLPELNAAWMSWSQTGISLETASGTRESLRLG